MYTLTFYSFKGGTGRTMALANVGLALANTGRRVLLVDFDLEAPGLDTFDLFRANGPTPGIVDLVTQYRKDHVAPDVTDFLYEPQNVKASGKLWVMPTGKQDERYGSRLNAIDWNHLYQAEDGYILFEDVKRQWMTQLDPDYVLIDSRTGHTDVGGICTRQLPDGVVLFFFPNEQNQRGLEVVVNDIRQEPRTISIYLVAANVPNLDDEEGILRSRLKQFEKALGNSIDATIHHYDSLSLLEQKVFTEQRPQTRLAREYNRLADRIISRNLEDRAVTLKFLEAIPGKGPPPRVKPYEIEARLQKIRLLYAGDGAILYTLAQANQALGRTRDARELFNEAEQFGFLSEEKLTNLAAEKYSSGESETARQLVKQGIRQAGDKIFALGEILTTVALRDPEHLQKLLGGLSLGRSQQMYLADKLMVRREVLPILEDIIRTNQSNGGRSQLAICLIAEGKFAEAQEVIARNAPNLGDLDIQDAFNYAMAIWGAKQSIPSELFAQVVRMSETERSGSPNYLQCVAIANWAVGKINEASENSRACRSALEEIDDFEFSAWRYLRVRREEFWEDLDGLDALIESGNGWPPAILKRSPAENLS